MLNAVATVLDAFLVMIEAIFWMATGSIDRVLRLVGDARFRRAFLIAPLASLGLILAFTLLKVFTGWSVFAYLAAIIAVVLSAIIGLLWTPLAVVLGMIRGQTVNPVPVGERYLRLIGVALFVDLMLSLGLLFVPWHRNLGALPLFGTAAAAVVIGVALWGGWFTGRFYTGLATFILAVVVLSFFFPQTFGAVAELGGGIEGVDRTIASSFKGAVGSPVPSGRGWSWWSLFVLLTFVFGILAVALNVVSTISGSKSMKAVADRLWSMIGLFLLILFFMWVDALFTKPARLVTQTTAGEQERAYRMLVSRPVVPGSPAPRPIPPTIVSEKGPAVWEVSVDGTNEIGYAEPPPGHRTKVVLRPGERVTVRHLGGHLAVNKWADKVALCGVAAGIRSGSVYRFPVQPHIAAVYVGLATPDGRFDARPWQCGAPEMVVENRAQSPAELRFWFNIAGTYRRSDGTTEVHGFSAAGWDGERARFEVRSPAAARRT